MQLSEKLNILAESAKYDVSCSSSGSRRKNTPGGIGNAAAAGICHSWSDDGRCISLLKILMTNDCLYDCAYCVNRRSNDIPRASFTPRELADLTIAFYLRNYIEGLFLSAAIRHSPDKTMEDMVEMLRLLREEHRFNGYIHVKAIPGADPLLIAQAGRLADRMSVNIELPSERSLHLLAPQKKRENILLPMGQICQGILQRREEKRRYRQASDFVPAGQSTQLMIGASPETDRQILRLSQGLYRKFQMKRVYYSAYMAVNTSSLLPVPGGPPPMLREHRLYQADWLLRFYHFDAEELLQDEAPQLDLLLDPKCMWALRNPEIFPIEINRADYQALLRIPGIGPTSARRIISSRRYGPLTFDSLKRTGAVLKRARYFITCQGKYAGGRDFDPRRIHGLLTAEETFAQQGYQGIQLSLEDLLHQETPATTEKKSPSVILSRFNDLPSVTSAILSPLPVTDSPPPASGPALKSPLMLPVKGGLLSHEGFSL
ncbi:putative DNA modification/repair radical SAM protein [Anoxynatronum buryatiense]|uniref:DNA modification/repair radical SAM protein n=1 Tax=Anoxynatronum buryatiense TaxID=489973 RepID=A0AA46AIZ0_9CLOT|nr:putative DNA modification/repair radical SAM protein [Anoxynatronum buryatiense]SMP54633.1 putative DNA modification/repair radical SAM protein [Anoxynatronum buryatiense]